MSDKVEYQVRAWFDERDGGQLFGPFAERKEAEECAKILAGRDGVLSVTIEKKGD